MDVEEACRDLTPWIVHHARCRVGHFPPSSGIEDLVQMAYLAIVATADTWQGMARPWGWLRCVIARRWADEMRRGEIPVGEGNVEDAPAHTLDPGSVVEHADMARRVWAAVEALPGRERVCVERYYLAGETQEEIAGILGVAPSRVCQLLSGARRRLRIWIGPPG